MSHADWWFVVDCLKVVAIFAVGSVIILELRSIRITMQQLG